MGQATPLRATLLARPLLAIAFFAISSAVFAESNSTDLVMQFLTNAHTGKPMRESDWLAKEARKAKKFSAFGGLNVLVKQSTAFAHQYGGLKSITILEVKQETEAYLVLAEVKFFDDSRRTSSPAIAEREDMTWAFRVFKENGQWKLSF